ncbi:MAG: efflux RND transporter periplasmic adaptor subunit [Betaproteobacteria bacterium]
MSISRKQKIAMVAIVVLGVFGAGAVLTTQRHQAGEEPETAEAAAAGVAPASGHAPAQPAHAEHAVRLDAMQAKKANIGLQVAGPGDIQTTAQFQGEVRFNDDRTAHVVPRLAGVAEAVSANLGETVRKGQVLAVVASTSLSEQRSELLTAQRRREAAQATYDREKKLWLGKISAEQDYLQASTALQEADIALENARQKLEAVGAGGRVTGNAGLNRLEIRAPFDGTVVEKHLALGEAVKEDASIFTVADLRTVWAEFAVAPKDLATVRVGQKVVVSSSAFDSQVEGVVSYVGALLGEQTRTARARVTLTNPQGAWRPGLFVTVAVLGDRQPVAMVVNADAIQTIENQTMVFKVVPGGFVATAVKVGRGDGRNVEVLAGLKAGDQVASSNTFILKAELGKSGAGEE